MGCMQRPRLATEELFREVVRVPQIEIADLWTLHTDDTKQVSCRYRKFPRIAWRYSEFGDLRQFGTYRIVKGRIKRWQSINRIPPLLCVALRHRLVASFGRVHALLVSLDPDT